MKTFKAVVKDKEAKEYSIIESDYATKQDFINDLRANGYSIYRNRVAESKDFDKLVDGNWQDKDYHNGL